MVTLLFMLLAVLFVTAAMQMAHTRRHARSSMLLSLGAVSPRWLTEHRGDQQ
jgi:hypothetical protein